MKPEGEMGQHYADIVEELQEQIRERDDELMRLRAIENSASWKTLRRFLNILDKVDSTLGRPIYRSRAELLRHGRDQGIGKRKIIFVHQGKAGGSTLVSALRHSYGSENVYDDRDRNARWAKRGIVRLVGEKLEGWRRYGDRASYRVIHGHFSPQKYRRAFPDALYITLFRNPIQQLVSLYHYWQRPLPFRNLSPEQRILLERKLSLTEFAELIAKSKRFSQIASLYRLEDFDFVGITEEFASSMELLKRKYLPDFIFDAEPCNTNPTKKVDDSYSLDPETMAHLERLFAPRLGLYEEAVARFRNECRQEKIDCGAMTACRQPDTGVIANGRNECGKDGTTAERFVIVCAARTGSTMLRRMLNSHPEVCCHGEVFSQPMIRGFVGLREEEEEKSPVLHMLRDLRERDPLSFLRQYVFNPGPFRAVGFKILYGYLLRAEWRPVFDEILSDRSIRIVHLLRENRLKRYLSNYIASTVTNVTVVFHEKDRPHIGPLTISPEECMKDIRDNEHAEQHFRDHFRNHPVFEITYEQIVQGNSEALRELQNFLGVSPASLTADTVKLNPDSLEQIIANYAEVSQALRGTRFERYLLG